MVTPGPGEIQLIDYDPNLASQTPDDEFGSPQEDPIINTQPNNPEPTLNTYIVTFQVRVQATNPLHAQLRADQEGGELINASAEMIDEQR